MKLHYDVDVDWLSLDAPRFIITVHEIGFVMTITDWKELDEKLKNIVDDYISAFGLQTFNTDVQVYNDAHREFEYNVRL